MHCSISFSKLNAAPAGNFLIKEGSAGTEKEAEIDYLKIPGAHAMQEEDIRRIIREETQFRIGTGFDVHRLTENRKLIIGGVEIPYTLGLDGHSDADVLAHAIMDALLGAASLKDIGVHFPDTDPQWKGADSMKLLEGVSHIISENGFEIVNIDSLVIAQKPKMSPFFDIMAENIARAAGIDKSKVSVKATTTEHLGFTGRQEGIAATAAALLRRLC